MNIYNVTVRKTTDATVKVMANSIQEAIANIETMAEQDRIDDIYSDTKAPDVTCTNINQTDVSVLDPDEYIIDKSGYMVKAGEVEEIRREKTKKMYEVHVQRIYDNRVFVEATSEEEAELFVYKFEQGPDGDKLFENENCEKEFCIPNVYESTKEEFEEDNSPLITLDWVFHEHNSKED